MIVYYLHKLALWSSTES